MGFKGECKAINLREEDSDAKYPAGNGMAGLLNNRAHPPSPDATVHTVRTRTETGPKQGYLAGPGHADIPLMDDRLAYLHRPNTYIYIYIYIYVADFAPRPSFSPRLFIRAEIIK